MVTTETVALIYGLVLIISGYFLLIKSAAKRSLTKRDISVSGWSRVSLIGIALVLSGVLISGYTVLDDVPGKNSYVHTTINAVHTKSKIKHASHYHRHC